MVRKRSRGHKEDYFQCNSNIGWNASELQIVRLDMQSILPNWRQLLLSRMQAERRAIIFRLFLIVITVVMNCRVNTIVKDDYRFSGVLCIAIQILELCGFIWMKTFYPLSANDPKIWSRILLFTFLIGACPSILLSEHGLAVMNQGVYGKRNRRKNNKYFKNGNVYGQFFLIRQYISESGINLLMRKSWSPVAFLPGDVGSVQRGWLRVDSCLYPPSQYCIEKGYMNMTKNEWSMTSWCMKDNRYADTLGFFSTNRERNNYHFNIYSWNWTFGAPGRGSSGEHFKLVYHDYKRMVFEKYTGGGIVTERIEAFEWEWMNEPTPEHPACTNIPHSALLKVNAHRPNYYTTTSTIFKDFVLVLFTDNEITCYQMPWEYDASVRRRYRSCCNWASEEKGLFNKPLPDFQNYLTGYWFSYGGKLPAKPITINRCINMTNEVQNYLGKMCFDAPESAENKSDRCLEALNPAVFQTEDDTPIKLSLRLIQLFPFFCAPIICSTSPAYVFGSDHLLALVIKSFVTAADIFDILECVEVALGSRAGITNVYLQLWIAGLLSLFFSSLSGEESSNSFIEDESDSESSTTESTSSTSTSSTSTSSTSTSSASSKSSLSEIAHAQTNQNEGVLAGPVVIFNPLGQDRQLRFNQFLRVFSDMKLWVIILPIMLQDMYFLFWRCYLMCQGYELSPSIIFFVTKNALAITWHIFLAWAHLGEQS